jgi:hypothetical protein
MSHWISSLLLCALILKNFPWFLLLDSWVKMGRNRLDGRRTYIYSYTQLYFEIMFYLGTVMKSQNLPTHKTKYAHVTIFFLCLSWIGLYGISWKTFEVFRIFYFAGMVGSRPRVLGKTLRIAYDKLPNIVILTNIKAWGTQNPKRTTQTKKIPHKKANKQATSIAIPHKLV